MDIYREISRYVHFNGTANILISGTTCSGKTTLANRVRDCLADHISVTVVSQDDYFRNLRDIPYTSNGLLMDSPEAFCQEEFKEDVKKLLANSVVKMPNYNIPTNTIIDKKKVVQKSKVNIFEGLHVIDFLSGFMPDYISIYLDTDMETCLSRRIQRDTSNLHVTEDVVYKYWNNCIKPVSENCILPQKDYADYVLWRW